MFMWSVGALAMFFSSTFRPEHESNKASHFEAQAGFAATLSVLSVSLSLYCRVLNDYTYYGPIFLIFNISIVSDTSAKIQSDMILVVTQDSIVCVFGFARASSS